MLLFTQCHPGLNRLDDQWVSELSSLYALQFPDTDETIMSIPPGTWSLSAATFVPLSNASGPTLDGILTKSQTLELLFFYVERQLVLLTMVLALPSGHALGNGDILLCFYC